MFELYNPSPPGARVGDCAVRALSKVFNVDWETAFLMICVKGFNMYDMPNSNAVIDAILRNHGYVRRTIANTCPDCYTVERFAQENPTGTFVLGTGTHVVAAVNGVIYDSWDSTKEYPIYYWQKTESEE